MKPTVNAKPQLFSRLTKLLIIGILGLGSSQMLLAQYTIPDKPKEQTSVYDYANLLDATQKPI